MKTSSSRVPSIATRALCLGLALLTGCQTTHPRYAWHDLTTPTGVKTKVNESWGEKTDTTVVDPEIAPGFLIHMRCLADPKLDGDYRVSFQGGLQLPYDIGVKTTDMTVSELKKKLNDLYRQHFKNSPDIDLQLKERRYWVDVRGLVEKPGKYLVEPEASLDAVIGAAGGTTKDPFPSYVRISKGQKIFVVDLNQYYSRGEDHPQILGWTGGEILFFQKVGSFTTNGEPGSASSYLPPVYMMGEVRKPGEYTLNPGSDFLDSVVLAGGFTERADLDKIEIIRRIGGQKRVYEFSWNALQHAPIPVQGDIIYVHSDSQTRTERRTYLVATIISAVAAILTSAVLVLAYNRNRI